MSNLIWSDLTISFCGFNNEASSQSMWPYGDIEANCVIPSETVQSAECEKIQLCSLRMTND